MQMSCMLSDVRAGKSGGEYMCVYIGIDVCATA